MAVSDDAGSRSPRSAGIPIGFGTDPMGPLEDDQLEGLRLQAEVEGPLEALRPSVLWAGERTVVQAGRVIARRAPLATDRGREASRAGP